MKVIKKKIINPLNNFSFVLYMNNTFEFDKQHFDKNLSCSDVKVREDNGEFVITGNTEADDESYAMYWAANPADFRQSFTGSGLPFPNPYVAYENTPNKGAVAVRNNKFQIRIKYPNAYYTELGNEYHEPHIYIKVCRGQTEEGPVHNITLGDAIPYRLLDYPGGGLESKKRKDVMFYNKDNRVGHRNQEEILRAARYPDYNVMATNHWGTKPPQ